MAKTIEFTVYRWSVSSCDFVMPYYGLWELPWVKAKAIWRNLLKGLRPGKSRKLTLTQTKRGIKLEVKP